MIDLDAFFLKEVDLTSVEDGKMYQLKVTWTHTDWETGICDDFGVGYVEINEEERKTK